MAITGTLEDLSFAEIVQVINQGRKNGELSITRIHEQAKVCFGKGEIVQAALKLPAPLESLNGAEVIYRLLGWKEGDFVFQRMTRQWIREIHETTDELVLEGMKQLDEWEKVTAEITDQNVVLRVKAGNVSDQYEELSNDARIILHLVDARRDVSALIRESGLDPAQAFLAITELMTHEVVEKWEQPATASMSFSL